MDAAKQSTAAFQLKASLHPFTVLQLDTQDTSAIVSDLQQRLAKAPQLLKNAPIVIELPNQPISLEWSEELITELKVLGFIPVGLRCQQEQHKVAEHLNLPLFNDSPKANKTKPPQSTPAKLVKQAVRSGQQVINPEGDLVVFGNVGQGAEVLASGSIHIYGTLYGRALAGINGDTTASITCQKLESELLAIAGQYQVSEDVANEHRQQTCHIFLKDERLIIQSV
ncbi:septum site-determining protein MinC [Oceaniserpentilla sp. 4NH20-0058]|uniref:septum site-determining protein MinC n=1 Tax=Oceaniserpentilla sp. 4NH20-0058 TaxID=3127660 RepID=UPI00310B6A2E